MPSRLIASPRRAVALSAAALVALSFGLGGCTTLEKARSAAIVNGTPISDADVAQATKEYNQNLATTPAEQIQESQALSLLVLAPFILGQVKRSGSWTPDAQYNNAMLKLPNASAATKDLVATSLAVRALSRADVDVILGELKKAKVDLDPRYGTFDPATGGSTATVNNWIKPNPTPSTTATQPPAQAPTDSSTDAPTGTSTGASTDVPTGQ